MKWIQRCRQFFRIFWESNNFFIEANSISLVLNLYWWPFFNFFIQIDKDFIRMIKRQHWHWDSPEVSNIRISKTMTRNITLTFILLFHQFLCRYLRVICQWETLRIERSWSTIFCFWSKIEKKENLFFFFFSVSFSVENRFVHFHFWSKNLFNSA